MHGNGQQHTCLHFTIFHTGALLTLIHNAKHMQSTFNVSQYVWFSSICLLYFCPLQTLDDDTVATGKEYQWQNRAVSEWTNQQVCHWLMGMNMDQYTPEFTSKGVDGQQLLFLDSDKLKVKKSV